MQRSLYVKQNQPDSEGQITDLLSYVDSRSLSGPTIASRSPPSLCELKIERGSKGKVCLSGGVEKEERVRVYM